MDLTKRNEGKSNVAESTRGYIYKSPDVDIYESKDVYKIIFDVPAIDKEDINIKVEKEVLTMTAECKKEPVEGYECAREEMDFTGYQRTFNLNGIVNTEKIEAGYENGTLILTLPKKEEEKTKEISIKIN
jgi:HSP20 family protein